MKGAEILANAVALEPLLREQAAENERLRRLNPTTAAALRSAGAFRLPMPAAWGGPEIDIVTQTEIVETLSRADGSAGWCAMIGSPDQKPARWRSSTRRWAPSRSTGPARSTATSGTW